MNKLSISVRIISLNTQHVWFKLYLNLIPNNVPHLEGTRALMGEAQCLRLEELEPFMQRLKPDLVTLGDKVDPVILQESTGLVLTPVDEYFMVME